LTKAAILALALALCGLANGIGFLLVVSFLVGFSATLAQDTRSSCGASGSDLDRARLWRGDDGPSTGHSAFTRRQRTGCHALRMRSVYGAAAIAVAIFAILAWSRLPHFKATTQLSYDCCCFRCSIFGPAQRVAQRPLHRAFYRWASAPSGPRWR